MTGPEHFKEAISALSIASHVDEEDPKTERNERYQLARAQVHATLALADMVGVLADRLLMLRSGPGGAE